MKSLFDDIAELVNWLRRSLYIPAARRLGVQIPEGGFFFYFFPSFLVIALKNESVPAVKKRGAPLLVLAKSVC